MKTKKLITYTICILFMIWFIVSFVDVISHNAGGDESYQYLAFNLFKLLIRR